MTEPATASRVPWRAIAVLGLVVTFAHAATLPLSDTDLPTHLAVGRWVWQHRAVPFVEPFAWTRAGAPYFAYSWLVQVAAYVALAALGPLGPHLMHGVLVAFALGAIVVLGRAAGWSPWTTFVVGVVHVLLLLFQTPSLRPQEVLYVAVPLAWAAAYWLERDARPARALILLFAASALAANSHLLFPLTAAPVLVMAVSPPTRRTRVLLAAAAVVLGWLVSPYALAWAAVFRLNFTPNALFRYPTAIDEYQPGFISQPFVGALLAALPLLALAGRSIGRRELALGALWLVGLIGFAQAEKTLTVWWLAPLPLAAMAAARVREPARVARARAIAFTPVALGAVLALQHLAFGSRLYAEEGTAATRRLPVRWAESAEPVVQWLERHARPPREARLFTTFNYGSYLMWRLPGYSASIDGRTIFPDSVAAPEAVVMRAFAGHKAGGRYDDRIPLGPWRSADVAIVPLRYPVASALDTATGWVRLPAPMDPSDALGLWARRAWWDSVRADSAITSR